jgi:16S rRNA G1207 methylase RsmC
MERIEHYRQGCRFEVELRGRPMVFHSTWGLFSPRRIDDGTYRLIKHAEVRPTDRILDVGCGYGPIGLALAAEAPQGTTHLVDKDFVALDLARKNAQVNGISNVEIYPSNMLSHVPGDARFDLICSNIPANVGKELLEILLNDAREHLADGGRLLVVTVAGLRKFMRRNLETFFGTYEKVKQGKTYTVARAVKQ